MYCMFNFHERGVDEDVNVEEKEKLKAISNVW